MFNDAYEIHKILNMGDEILREDEVGFNTHEFTTNRDGTKALYMTRLPKRASEEDSLTVGFDRECFAIFDGIRELDTSTWQTIGAWNSEGHIGLDESYADQEPIDRRCAARDAWDFL